MLKQTKFCQRDVVSESKNRKSLKLQMMKGNKNIESVVDKANQAGAKLWLLLHAQSCRLGVGGRICPHGGCSQAKLLNLHVKLCTNNSTTDCCKCPDGYQGCEPARKLISHYKKCSKATKFKEAIKQQLRQQKNLSSPSLSSLALRRRQKHASAPSLSPSPIASLPPKGISTLEYNKNRFTSEQFCLICSVVHRKNRLISNGSTTKTKTFQVSLCGRAPTTLAGAHVNKIANTDNGQDYSVEPCNKMKQNIICDRPIVLPPVPRF